MKIEKGSFLLLGRDDGVLIPGKVNSADFQDMDVEFGDGVSWENIEDEDVAMLQSQTENKMQFVRITDQNAFFDSFDDHMAKGLFPVGFGMVRFYPTLEKYEESEEE